MKKILYLTILVMTLMPCVSVYSQLGDLNRSLIESMPGLTNNSISEAGDETDVEEVSKSSKAKEEVNFEDNNDQPLDINDMDSMLNTMMEQQKPEPLILLGKV